MPERQKNTIALVGLFGPAAFAGKYDSHQCLVCRTIHIFESKSCLNGSRVRPITPDTFRCQLHANAFVAFDHNRAFRRRSHCILKPDSDATFTQVNRCRVNALTLDSQYAWEAALDARRHTLLRLF